MHESRYHEKLPNSDHKKRAIIVTAVLSLLLLVYFISTKKMNEVKMETQHDEWMMEHQGQF